MKKLVAFLTVCAMMTGVFASCGNEEKEESESKVSVSESSEEDKTTEPETETESETEAESETEEETESETEHETETEAETESETETEPETEGEAEAESEVESAEPEVSEESAVGEAVSDESIVGTWFTEDDDVTMGFNFKDDGNADILMDMTELTHFTSDGKLFMDNEVFESDCINYDGTTLVVTVNEKEAFTMIKESGSADGFDGVYTMKSGAIYDSLMSSCDESTEILVIVSGEKLYSGYKDMFTYSASNGTVKMTGLETIGIEEDIESQYEINGDVITLHDFDGEEMTMTRLDF